MLLSYLVLVWILTTVTNFFMFCCQFLGPQKYLTSTWAAKYFSQKVSCSVLSLEASYCS